MTSLTTKVIFRLVGVYLWAFACVLWPHFREPWHRAACLYCVAMWARRPGRDFPVMVSAACMWLGEVVAVRVPSTWKYDGFGHDVPPWLLPLWILSAMFTVDAADATRCKNPAVYKS